MDILYRCCAGLDVHKKTVVACVRRLDAAGQARQEIRTFGTMTCDLLALSDWLAEQGVDAQVVELSGSVEIAPRLGTADLICDLVSSGATLRANQLTPVHNLLDSEAVLAGAVRVPDDARASLRAMLLRRLDGVVQRQDRKLLMFRASEDRVDALSQLLADAEPLVRLPADGGALRLQTMCPGPLSWQRMEELERAGAQGLMVLSVERSLA